MNYKFLTVLAGVSLVASVYAAPISPEEALARASKSMPSRVVAKSIKTLAPVYTAKTVSGEPAAYVFNNDEKGFFILSGNDLAYPVLGYSNEGEIDVDNMSPQLKWWMDEYTRQIEWAESNGISQVKKVYAPNVDPIQPLLTTKWNQDAPFNLNCPYVQGVQAPSGCVATSFAQVMNYFKYPEKGKGTIRYNDSYGVSRTLSLSQSFDWVNMLDDYSKSYNDEQAEAVAFLMQACGYSVEMGYGQYASGAISYKIANAAVKYFRYDDSVQYCDRTLYSPAQWFDLIYNNLKNVGPVIYNGTTIDGGHSFVCDGYDGNGYFHINWGWGGLSDGYFLLDSLNPDSQGIGGAEGGFSYAQSAVIGLKKPDDETLNKTGLIRVYGNVSASLTDNKITFFASNSNHPGWSNGSYTHIKVNVGAIISKAENPDEVVANVVGKMVYPLESNYMNSVELDAMSYFPTSSVNPQIEIPADLNDGTYKVTLATRNYNDETSTWAPMLVNFGLANYCYLTVDGSNYTVTSGAAHQLEFDKCEFDSPLYSGRTAKIVASIKNSNEYPMSVCFYPALMSEGNVLYKGDYIITSVDANTTENNDFIVNFHVAADDPYTSDNKYELHIFNQDTGEDMGNFGEYEMEYISSGLKVVLDNLSIADADITSVTSGNRTFDEVYKKSDLSDVKINFKYTVAQGYFDTSVRLIGARYNKDTNKFENFDDNIYFDMPFLGQGDSDELVIDLDCSSFDPASIYRIAASYEYVGANKTLGIIYLGFDDSAVDSIEVDAENANAEYFNLQGFKVSDPKKGQLLIRKVGESVEKIVF